MSEHNISNSNINNDKNNIDNSISEIKSNDNSVNERKRKSVTQYDTMSKQLKNNYYAILDNDKHCNKEYLSKFEKHVNDHEPSTSQNSAQAEKKANSEKITIQDQNKNKKIPPLNIFNVEPNELIQFIEKGLEIKNFKIKELNKKTSLFMSSIDDYLRVKAYLQKTKTEFFTFTPKSLKTKTFLLKGLSANLNCDEIYQELCKYNNDHLKILKASQFKTKKSIMNGQNLPIYLIQVSGETSLNQLKSINGLFHRCIRWEPLKKSEIPQCRKCQSFFHSASNCFLKPRCVKCDKMHDIGKCEQEKVSENEREKLFCVLCLKYGHPASYRGCEKYKEMQQRLRAKKQSLSEKRSLNKPLNITHSMSFANVLKNNQQITSSPNSTQQMLEQLNNTMQNLSNQLINLHKQLQLQTSRIDTIFSMLD